jgi:uncharacterized protein YbjT (DUF2867 family)
MLWFSYQMRKPEVDMIVVTGATGLIGRQVVEALAAQGNPVRAVTRNPNATMPPGVEVAAPGPAAYRGATALFVNGRAVRDDAAAEVARAVDAGARRIVALSAINVDDDPAYQPSRLQGDRNREAEAAAVGSGVPWVSLRACTFADNTRLAWGPQLQVGDAVRYGYPTFQEAHLDDRDLAEVAVRALLDPELTDRRLVLTGPESLSLEETLDQLGEVLNRPLRYVALSPDDAHAAMVARGLPAEFATALMARYARYDHTPHPVTDDVATVLGRPARTFRQWAADHTALFPRN